MHLRACAFKKTEQEKLKWLPFSLPRYSVWRGEIKVKVEGLEGEESEEVVVEEEVLEDDRSSSAGSDYCDSSDDGLPSRPITEGDGIFPMSRRNPQEALHTKKDQEMSENNQTIDASLVEGLLMLLSIANDKAAGRKYFPPVEL